MEMDPDGVRAGAGRLRPAGTEFQGKAAALLRKLQAEGPCWGDDETGQAFAKDYVPAADAISQAVSDVANALVQIADNLKTQADRTQQTDQGAAQTFKNQQV
ncbi:WXG100 family type VII secretion target [Actinocrispum sp. NPDC049592]|uniref:WXG100 family type VII secretion target n=1 Tax=Actinocrispum sp. NPDC049592 TaxID=3154835 RepID=UPI0034216CC1